MFARGAEQTASLSCRIPVSLAERLAALAEAEQRSVADVTRRLLGEAFRLRDALRREGAA